jgi:hypothetical protein
MSVFKKLFRPGSGGPRKGISIVDTQDGRARIRNPIGPRTIDDDIEIEGQFYPMILSDEIDIGGVPTPTGRLSGVDKEGNIPRYEADDPVVLQRLFGIIMPDE